MDKAYIDWAKKEQERVDFARTVLPGLVPEYGIKPDDFHENAIDAGVRADISHFLLLEFLDYHIFELDKKNKIIRGSFWPDGMQGEDDPR